MTMRTVHKELRPLLVEARRRGCTVGFTKKMHLKITCPGGEVIIMPGTPTSTRRARKNLIVQLRQRGVDLRRDS